MGDQSFKGADVRSQQTNNCSSDSEAAMVGFLAANKGGRFPGLQHANHDLCGCEHKPPTPNVSTYNVSTSSLSAFYLKHLVGDRGTDCKYVGGLEVGALNHPAPVPDCARDGMLYVDQVGSSELHALYPELRNKSITSVQLLDDGNVLSQVPSASRGFLIASHVIEHMPHTLLAVESWLRVVRGGGIVLIRAPWKCISFDRSRPVTSWSHFMSDYHRGVDMDADVLWLEHLPEWTMSHLQHLCGTPGGTVGSGCAAHFSSWHSHFVDRVLNQNFMRRGGVHFHTWTQQSWLEFWWRAHRALGPKVPFRVQDVGVETLDDGATDLFAVLSRKHGS